MGAVVEIVQQTSRRVQEAIADGEITIVLGGDCTVGVGTVCGHVAAGERVGLVYFDTHADLNIPSAVPEGALDWMGMAHMLGLPGAVTELVNAGSRVPLLDAEQVLLFGWGPEQATHSSATCSTSARSPAFPLTRWQQTLTMPRVARSS